MNEMSEHRVPMLGASWRRSEDPALSRDPRIRAVVGALATLPGPGPNSVFRAELRAQLVAIAPRIIAESAPAAPSTLTDNAPAVKPAATTARPKHADGVFARLRGVSLGRPLAVATAVLTAFVVLLGGAVWMSQKSVPGDTLYGLKRASESVRLDLASSDTSKAKLYLEFAGRRADEANTIASRATADAMGTGYHAGVIDSHTADLIASSLGSADSDVKNATTLLTKQAVASNSSDPLKIITEWAPSQIARLRQLAASMPDGALRQRAQSSASLVTAAATRAKALVPAVVNGCASAANADSLGVLPTGGCGAVPTAGAPGPGKHGNKSRKPGASNVGTNTGPAVVPVTEANSPSTTPDPSDSSSTTKPPFHLPTLPIHLPTLPTKSLPVSVSSCGLGMTIGPIAINLGACPSP
jgi:Domain of unknown function (DUF5667)